MLSIKHLLKNETPVVESKEFAWYRFSTSLVHGLEEHAVEYVPAEAQQLRAELKAIHTSMQGLLDSQDTTGIQALWDRANGLVREYNDRLAETIRLQQNEYQSLVVFLTRALASMVEGSEEAVANLHQIGNHIENAAALPDIRDIRNQLSHCLDELGRERTRLTRLQDQVNESEPAQGEVEIDRSTGLPVRHLAEYYIRQAIEKKETAYAVVFVVDRVQAVNMRFGYKIGDEMLKAFSLQLVKALDISDRCFRWSGPSIVAVVRSDKPLPVVRMEIQRILSSKIDRTLQVGSRSVLIPLSVTWTALSLLDASNAEQVHQATDAFVAGQPPEHGAPKLSHR